jgi:hypothetical protein
MPDRRTKSQRTNATRDIVVWGAAGAATGHEMIFRSSDCRLMVILHQPFNRAESKPFELEDTGDTIRFKRQWGLVSRPV